MKRTIIPYRKCRDHTGMSRLKNIDEKLPLSGELHEDTKVWCPLL